jgi:hypothetical protein
MSKLTPVAEVRLYEPHLRYGYVEFKPFCYEVRMSDENETSRLYTSNITIDTEIRSAYLTPQYNPVMNTLYGDWIAECAVNGTAGTVVDVVDPTTKTGYIYQPEATVGVRWSATTVSTACREWWLDYWLSYPAATGTGVVPEMQVVFPYESEYQYRVTINTEKWPVLEYSTNSGSDWKQVGAFPVSNLREEVGFAQFARMMFQRLHNYTIVRLGNNVVHHYSSDFKGTGAILLNGTNCAAAFASHRLTYATSGTIYSPLYTKDTPTVTDGTVVLFGGKQGDTDSYSGTCNDDVNEFSFTVTLSSGTNSEGVATTTPFINRISVQYPGKQIAVVSSPCTILPGLRSISEETVFDRNTLNVYSHIVAEFNNYDGLYRQVSGLRACEVDIGYAELGVHKRITGIAGYTMEWATAPGDFVFRLHIYDRSMMLRAPSGVIVANLPYMDGWCVYRAMRYLANYAGIQDSSLGFPICDGDINNPCGHYLLPFGDDMYPLVRFEGGMYVWDCMQKLQKYTGYLLYFDAEGILQFKPYVPEYPGPFKKTFSLVPEENYAGRPLLNEMFISSRIRDMTYTRNDVTIIGIDPETWQPIRASRVDNNSIYDTTAPNYMGYRAAFVWADSMFCTPEYAAQARDSIFNVMRLPADTIAIEGWMQPDIFPLDVIGACDPYSLEGLRPYWVVSVRNQISFVPGIIAPYRPHCIIQAEWLTPWG